MRKIAIIWFAVTLGLAQGVNAESWHTYHGAYGLTGVSTHEFSTKPVRLWRAKVGTDTPSPVVGGNGSLFCIADDSKIISFDTKGSNLWARTITLPALSADVKPTNESFSAPPLYANKYLLVVAAESGNVYGISTKDGKTLWTYDAGAEIQSTPNIAAGKKKGAPDHLFVITMEDGVLHAVNAADGTELWQSKAMDRTDGHIAVAAEHVVLGNCTASFLAVNITDGKLAATIDLGEGCEMAGGLAASKGQVFSGNRSGSFAAADLKTQSLLWLNEESEGELFTTPAVTDKYAVFHGADALLYCIDRTSAKQEWSKKMPGSDPLSPIIAGDTVIAGVDGTLFGMALKSGRARWILRIGDEISAPAIIDGMIVVGVDDGYIAAYGIKADK